MSAKALTRWLVSMAKSYIFELKPALQLGRFAKFGFSCDCPGQRSLQTRLRAAWW
jgi:hypothetical protein